MLTLFRDPIWQFIGATVAFLSLGLSIYLFILERRRKSLTFRVVGETELVSLAHEIESKVQVLYEGKLVQNVQLVVLRIFNDGNIPITSLDYVRPLTFSFDEQTNILNAEITDSEPHSLRPSLSVKENQVILEPTLLNSRDSVQITLLLSQYNGKIDSDARIVGVREVKQATRPSRRVSSVVPDISLSSIIRVMSKTIAFLAIIALALLFIFVEQTRLYFYIVCSFFLALFLLFRVRSRRQWGSYYGDYFWDW